MPFYFKTPTIDLLVRKTYRTRKCLALRGFYSLTARGYVKNSKIEFLDLIGSKLSFQILSSLENPKTQLYHTAKQNKNIQSNERHFVDIVGFGIIDRSRIRHPRPRTTPTAGIGSSEDIVA